MQQDDQNAMPPQDDSGSGSQPTEIELLRQENEQLKNQALRAMADLQNYRRRAEEEKKSMLDFASTSIVLDILPVIDNFQRSLEHLPEDLKNNEWVKGVEHILAQCLDLLERWGVKAMEASAGDAIDPNLHQVVMHEEGEEGRILEVFEKGYTINGRVLRTAKVKAGRQPA